MPVPSSPPLVTRAPFANHSLPAPVSLHERFKKETRELHITLLILYQKRLNGISFGKSQFFRHFFNIKASMWWASFYIHLGLALLLISA